MNFNLDPLDIFQKCKVAYQALETTCAVHDANDLIPCKKPVHRHAKEEEKKKSATPKSAVPFPKNVNGLVPSHIYGMMKK